MGTQQRGPNGEGTTVELPCGRRIRVEICSDRLLAAEVVSHMLVKRGHHVTVVPAPTPEPVDVRVVDEGAAWHVRSDGGDAIVQTIDDLVVAVESEEEMRISKWRPEQLPARSNGAPWSPRSLGSFLTTREREVLSALADGASTSALAQRLGVRPATVRAHIQSVLSKLCVHSRVEAVVFALEHGLLGYDDRRSA